MFTGDMSVALAVQAVQLFTERLDEVPVDREVKAGWTALLLFFLLIGAVVVLGFSLVKQLRKTEANRKAGVFGPVDDDPADSVASTAPNATTPASNTDSDTGSEPRQTP